MSATKKALTFDIDRSPPIAPALPKQAKAGAQEERKHVGARVTAATYRQLKARAAMQGEKVQDLVEKAITEFLANHPD
jgi:hypothetical protein